MRPLITLLTDFGTRDGYVAELKAAVLCVEPEARIVDISHDVAPGAVDQAAWLLETVHRAFPPGSVHLAVVDPGVGTDRPAIAVDTTRHRFVAPDNGLLARALRGSEPRVVDLDPARLVPGELSATFHGRDLFAPAAAHLSHGDPLAALGTLRAEAGLATAGPVQVGELPVAVPVVHVDRFGNVVLDLLGSDVGPEFSVATPSGKRVEHWYRTYGDAPADATLLLVGSSGYVEIAVRDGDAARRLELSPGVRCRLLPPGVL